MTKLHHKCKTIRLEHNGEVKDFPSRKTLLKYMRDIHGIGETTVRLIISSQEPYKPRTHSLKYLTGLRIYYI